MRTTRHHQCGVGIIEIMIALTISLVLTAGVVQFYLGSKQSYRLEDALSRVQETGRFAINAIAADARMADFWGCGARSSLNLVNNLDKSSSSTYFPFHQAVLGTNNSGGFSASDTLTLRSSQSIGANILSYASSIVTVSPAVRESVLDKGDYVVLCNPVSADIVRLTSANGGASETNDKFGVAPGVDGNAPAGSCLQSSGVNAVCFATKYDTAAEMSIATQKTYLIQAGTSGQPGLFVRINGSPVRELIEGVEDMQILYGEDINDDRQVDRYVVAGAVGLDMQRVISLQVALLVRSLEANVTTEPQPINFNGATISGSDRRLRQVYTATLALRNRVL